MAAAALQPAAALNLGGVSATVRTNPENADTKLIGNVMLIEVASIMGAGQHPASALIQAEASGRCCHSLAPAPRVIRADETRSELKGQRASADLNYSARQCWPIGESPAINSSCQSGSSRARPASKVQTTLAGP